MEALVQITNLTIRLDVKYEVDSGRVEALATDVAGTQVLFNKSFKDVESIVVSAKSTVERKIVYNFVDAPNPTEFFIFVYDTSGARVDATCTWIARGVR